MQVKLPHWAQLLFAFLAVALAWLMQQQTSGNLTLPAWGVTILSLVNVALGWWSTSVSPSLNAKAVAKKIATAGLSAMIILFVSAPILAACLSPASPATQADNVATEIACVEDNWGKPVATVAATCVGGEVSLAEDLIADVEWLFEQAQGVDGGGAVATVRPFPYAADARIEARLAARRARTAP
jgi:heme A synthase